MRCLLGPDQAARLAHGKLVKLTTEGRYSAARTPMISIPIINHDNSQHSFNENLRLQNLWDGIETMAGLLTMDK